MSFGCAEGPNPQLPVFMLLTNDKFSKNTGTYFYRTSGFISKSEYLMEITENKHANLRQQRSVPSLITLITPTLISFIWTTETSFSDFLPLTLLLLQQTFVIQMLCNCGVPFDPSRPRTCVTGPVFMFWTVFSCRLELSQWSILKAVMIWCHPCYAKLTTFIPSALLSCLN